MRKEREQINIICYYLALHTKNVVAVTEEEQNSSEEIRQRDYANKENH